MSRSGFFIDAKGSVLTTLQAVETCGKIVLERTTEAQITFSDPASGIAVLAPNTPLAPKTFAAFAPAVARIGTLAALSGYSYEDKLPAPVVTNGTVEDIQGLNGESGLIRLTLAALPGDQGGPVLDATGAVMGMLLPADAKAAKQLPDGVTFAVSAAALAAVLTAKGLAPTTAAAADQATPDALAAAARGMTVLVSCWE